MTELLPYEQQLQQQWIDLPLPDENMAWADMKRRLEEDDNDGIIAWWRRGCVLWGVVLLTAVGILWWIGQRQEWFTNASKQTTNGSADPIITPSSRQIETGVTEKQQLPGDPLSTIPPDSANRKNGQTTQAGGEQQTNSAIVNTQSARIGRTGTTSAGRNNTVNRVSNSSTINTTTESARRNRAGIKDPAQVSFNAQPANRSGKNMRAGKDEPIKNDNRNQVVKNNDKDEPAHNTIPKTGNVVPPPADSIIASVTQLPDSSGKKTDSSVSKAKGEEKPPVPAAKKDSTKKNTHFFSAGIAIHQLIPVDGQKATPYNSLGRKGSLADYIPSVYFRYNKTDKWFVQAEIRYGAPQYTKEFVYKQTKIPGQLFTDSASFKLQKTYYHQLPLTFNYYVVKNWSIGAGLIWNRFSSAVSEVENYRRDNISLIDSLQSIQIAKDKGDSLFSKSYFQAAFESHFQWKRLSVGARYSFGLQPYIKFALPNGIQRQERNSSLQLFLRYDLWRSKKK
jgi:hypothetical protein